MDPWPNPSSPSSPSLPPPHFSAPPSRGASGKEQRNGGTSLKNGKDSGFALVFLCLLLTLAFLTLAGTVLVVRLSQEKVALQSRLDICTLRITLARKAFLEQIGRTNQMITVTKYGIYAARGAMVLTGPVGAVVAGTSEKILLQTNKALATAQDLHAKLTSAKELAGSYCPASPFSKSLVLCTLEPNLAKSLFRASTLFPDVKGELQMKGSSLGRFRCAGKGLRTAMILKGNQELNGTQIKDEYEE